MKRTAFFARGLGLTAIAAFCASLAVSVPGCTILGIMAGAAADHGGTGGFDKLMSVPVGTTVTLTLWDKSTVKGRFTGWSLDSTDTLGDMPVAETGSSITAPPLPAASVRHAVATPRSPMPSMRDAYVHLDTNAGNVSVPAGSIALVSVPSNGAVVVGLLAGLTMDILVIRSMRGQPKFEPQCAGPPPDWGTFSRTDAAPREGARRDRPGDGSARGATP